MTRKLSEIEKLQEKRNEIDKKIQDKILQIYGNFTQAFVEIYGIELVDIPSSKKGCIELINNLRQKDRVVVSQNAGIQSQNVHYNENNQ